MTAVFWSRHLIMRQLKLQNHTMLLAKKIFASKQIEISHSDEGVIVMFA